MSKESQLVPVGEHMIKIRQDEAGKTELVIVDHADREDVVPVQMTPRPLARRAA